MPFWNLLTLSRMFHPIHSDLVECNVLRFRLFTLLHTRHKLLSRWKLSHCCGLVVGPSTGTLFEWHTITTLATRRGHELQDTRIKWMHFIHWHVWEIPCWMEPLRWNKEERKEKWLQCFHQHELWYCYNLSWSKSMCNPILGLTKIRRSPKTIVSFWRWTPWMGTNKQTNRVAPISHVVGWKLWFIEIPQQDRVLVVGCTRRQRNLMIHCSCCLWFQKNGSDVATIVNYNMVVKLSSLGAT